MDVYQGQLSNSHSKYLQSCFKKAVLIFEFPIQTLKMKLHGRGKCNLIGKVHLLALAATLQSNKSPCYSTLHRLYFNLYCNAVCKY